ncbi:hypothetical protein ACFYN3_12335 [Streptomyces lavendulae]|uniref:hypothetical protein n=1 Tax=Streptomyces lavendulae TaxID=1914 RepID=UPI0036CD2095
MHSHQTAGDVVAAQIRRHRERLGMNRNDLAAECARLGRPDITYAVIVSIETGRAGGEGKQRRRPVTVDDLLVLGLALATPPLLLMLPLGSETTVPTVPAADPRDPYTVWQWMTGEATPTLDSPLDGRYVTDSRQIAASGQTWSAAWATAAYPASLYPEFERRRFAVTKAHRRAMKAGDEPVRDKERATDTRQDYFEHLEQLAYHIDDMTRAGLTIPRLPAIWIEDMKGLAMLDNPDSVTPEEDD